MNGDKVNLLDELTLRDYFAAAALQSFSRGAIPTSIGGIGEACYAMADAMLAERAK